ncbi:MAG: sulfur carrier protein ThiS [Desulfobacteraceae bacterium]|nr:sulfur carrier protein ThiS [Desulfobacteraceae bacterium]
MKIICNGQEREVAPATTITGLIRELGLNPETVVAEHNGRVLAREEHEFILLDEGAVLELIRFVGGG